MELNYQSEIDNIQNCPAKNENGVIKLFRCVETPMTEDSFIPVAILKPKFKDKCIAWDFLFSKM